MPRAAVLKRTRWARARSWSALAGQSSPPPRPAAGPLLLSLERSIGERLGVDSTLWKTGAFHAQGYPDLPFAATWNQLIHKLLSASAAAVPAPPATPHQGGLVVRTIGAQCRSRDQLQGLMRSACSPGGDADPAGALLFVSGSHPARQLPLAQSLLQSSFSMLRDARELRARGYIPPSTALWAVENPMSPPERLLRKVEAGAEAVLTQPPFDRAASERWFAAAASSGVTASTRILAGVPMASSAGNLEFWLRLCGMAGTSEAAAVLDSFPAAGSVSNKEEMKAAVRKWNAEFVRWVSAFIYLIV